MLTFEWRKLVSEGWSLIKKKADLNAISKSLIVNGCQNIRKMISGYPQVVSLYFFKIKINKLQEVSKKNYR